jgi:hypothetical protein
MRLSVVVTIVDGGAALERCVAALLAQQDAPAIDVILPFDDTAARDVAFAAALPAVRLVPLGAVGPLRQSRCGLSQHALYDWRRAAGVAAARGDVVALVEDRAIPRVDWAAAIARLHREQSSGAIGGAVENADAGTLNWAVYFCDFGRYQLPFSPGAATAASDVNVSYKRSVLDSIRSVWIDGFHEPTVHAELVRRGAGMFRSPDVVVYQARGPLHLGALCRERVVAGRRYASIRSTGMSRPSRLARILATPLLPFVLVCRTLRDRLKRDRSIGRFAAALPAVLLLLSAWSLGEAIGYVRSEPSTPNRPAT